MTAAAPKDTKGELIEEHDPLEEGKIEDGKRKFLSVHRPHEKIWNFIEDKDPTPHVLRYNADPRLAYSAEKD